VPLPQVLEKVCMLYNLLVIDHNIFEKFWLHHQSNLTIFLQKQVKTCMVNISQHDEKNYIDGEKGHFLQNYISEQNHRYSILYSQKISKK
jgi:hypothetical protein